MKTRTCNQLGGACDEKFHAETWEEMAEKSKNHGAKMMQAGSKSHLEAMGKMKKLMTDSKAMGEWFESKKKAFEDSPKD